MTDSLATKLAEVVGILKGAKQEYIEGRRCFVVPRWQFYRIYELLPDNDTGQGDIRVGYAGNDNYQINLTVADKETYLVCCLAEPVMDAIWKSKETPE